MRIGILIMALISALIVDGFNRLFKHEGTDSIKFYLGMILITLFYHIFDGKF